VSAQALPRWPEGKRFAFSILDDTDDATTENVAPVYQLLHELGFRTTKTVWPLDCPEGSPLFFAAETLEDPAYLAFTRELVSLGFEIASHGATMESSTRERTRRGLERITTQLGVSPRLYCNHAQNLENLYWGSDRYTVSALRAPLAFLERLLGRPRYQGQVEQSPFFWGDICKEQFTFVRSFAFATMHSRVPLCRPYRLRQTPWVNYWFSTSDAPDVTAFRALVTRDAIDRLEATGGACIVSTHLGKGFAPRGRVDPAFEDVLRYIASRPGWLVPVSTLLDQMLTPDSDRPLGLVDRWRIETAHLADRLRDRVARKRRAA
jgi:hypothetical protein